MPQISWIYTESEDEEFLTLKTLKTRIEKRRVFLTQIAQIYTERGRGDFFDVAEGECEFGWRQWGWWFLGER